MSETTSVQQELESLMTTFLNEGRWSSVVLFSSDGLPMASAGESFEYSHDKLLEFAFSQIETVRMLDSDLPVTEVVIQASRYWMLVFRFFEGGEEQLILAAVVNRKKGYRRAMNQIIRRIQNLI